MSCPNSSGDVAAISQKRDGIGAEAVSTNGSGLLCGSVHLERVNSTVFSGSDDTLTSKKGVFRYLKSVVFG